MAKSKMTEVFEVVTETSGINFNKTIYEIVEIVKDSDEDPETNKKTRKAGQKKGKALAKAEMYQCTLCDHPPYRSKGWLTRHHKTSCKGDKSPPVNVVGEGDEVGKSMRVTEKVILIAPDEIVKGRFTCNICDSGFDTKYSLNKHQQNCTEEMKEKCAGTEKTTVNKNNMKEVADVTKATNFVVGGNHIQSNVQINLNDSLADLQIDKHGGNKRVFLLKNGHTCATYTIYNTCAFNAITHIFVALYACYGRVKRELDKSNSPFMEFVKKIALWNDMTESDHIYTLRTELLYPIFGKGVKITQTNGLPHFEIDCDVTIAYMYEKLVADIFSYELLLPCPNLEILGLPNEPNRQIKYISVDLNILSNSNFSSFPTMINLDSTQSSQCLHCGENRKPEIVFADLIAIDVQLEEGFAKRSIGEIPPTISIHGLSFKLVAFIAFDSTLRHFIGHVKRSSQEWECYDDLEANVYQSKLNQKFNLTFLFYIKY